MADILFIKPGNASFVENDERLLAALAPLRAWRFYFTPFWRLAWNQGLLLLRLLRHGRRARLYFVWFADYHALWPVLLARLWRKRCLIVLGGYDVARLPEFDYGAHLWPLRSRLIRYCLRHASLLLPVSQATAAELEAFAPHAPAEVLYNGVDGERFRRRTDRPRNDRVLTVCGGRDLRAARIKGIELYIACSRRLPDLEFTVVGLAGAALEYARSLSPGSNLRFLDPVPAAELIDLYSQSRVYCQFSIHESFGMATAEAMLCECVPVVTDSGALPEVVGDAGLILPDRSVDAAIAAIRAALADDGRRAALARARILERFTLSRRAQRLQQLLDLS